MAKAPDQTQPGGSRALQSPVKQALAKLDSSLKRMLPQIAEALPHGFEAAKMARVLMTEAQKNPALLECSQSSILRAMLQSAQLGLYPDSVLGHAYLVPFRNTKKPGSPLEAVFIVGYRGLIELIHRSDRVAGVSAHVVYSNDSFEIELGTSEHIKHVPTLQADRGERIGAYMVAQLKDGSKQIEFLTTHDVMRHKQSSKAKTSELWTTHEDEAWRKTAVRQGAKYLPLSPEDARKIASDALEEDETIELTEFMDLGDGGAFDVTAAATRANAEELKAKYTPKPREPGDEPDPDADAPEGLLPFECCGGVESHFNNCVNFVPEAR